MLPTFENGWKYKGKMKWHAKEMLSMVANTMLFVALLAITYLAFDLLALVIHNG